MKNKQKNITKLLITKLIECKSYLIGGIIIGLIISNVFAFWKKEGSQEEIISKMKSEYSLVSPARNLFDKGDLIVNIQPLRDVFQKMGDENPNLSIYFEFLNTGANIAVNKDMAIWPASLMKIPIAMAVMKKIEEGSWQMDSELVLYEEDKDDRFGDLYQKPAGSRFTVEELLLQLLDRSDNTARTILMRNLEKGEIEAVLNHLGIEDIFDKENKVTGKKYSIFWRALYTASYLSQEHSQQLIEIMTKSETNEYLSLGIPKNVLFSHKIGVIYENNIYADSGIVYVAERPYVITVMIQDQNQEEAEKIMQEISQKAYNYVENY